MSSTIAKENFPHGGQVSNLPEGKSHDIFKVRVTADEIKENFEKWLGFHETALAKLQGTKLILIGKKGGKSDLVKKHEVQIRTLKFVNSHIAPGDVFYLTLNEVSQLALLNDILDPDDTEEA